MQTLRTTLTISLILLLCAATANAKIIFSTWENGKAQIFVMDDNGRNITPINDNPYSEWRPRWSPNGRQIAFIRDTTPNDISTRPDIFIMNANGSNARQITDEFGAATDLRYSPDGRKLLYHNYLIGLYTIDIDTRETNLILRNHIHYCDWSPDGKQIVFINDDHDIIEKNLWFVDANGDNMRQWTHPDPERGGRHRFYPRWSPDGKQMLYIEMDIIVNILWDDDGGKGIQIRSTGTFRIIIHNIDDDTTRTLKTPENWFPISVEWMDGQRSVLFSAHVYDRDNDLPIVMKIYKYDLATDEITFLAEGSRAHWNGGELPITPEGKQSVRWAELKRTYTK